MSISVKICGVTDLNCVEVLNEMAVDYAGFVFFEHSPRRVSSEKAAQLSAGLDRKIKKVAVLVNPAEQMLQNIAKSAFCPDFLQLHGNESKEIIQKIKNQMKIPVIKVIKIGEKSEIQKIKNQILELQLQTEDKIMFDAAPDEKDIMPGGIGKRFYWPIIKNLNYQKKFFIAGGLNAHNVQNAINQSGSTMVDVSSALETQIGTKNATLVKQFVRKAKNCKVNLPNNI